MEPQYIYLKSGNLDDKNKFRNELTKDNEVEEVESSKNQNYLFGQIGPRIEDKKTKMEQLQQDKKALRSYIRKTEK